MLQDSKSYFIEATGRVPLPNRHWQRGVEFPFRIGTGSEAGGNRGST